MEEEGDNGGKTGAAEMQPIVEEAMEVELPIAPSAESTLAAGPSSKLPGSRKSECDCSDLDDDDIKALFVLMELEEEKYCRGCGNRRKPKVGKGNKKKIIL